MNSPRATTTYGEGPIDRLITELVASVGTDKNDDLIRKMVVTALQMDEANVDRLELKIASQTMAEMLNAYKVFSQHQDRAKVTVFGSARTRAGSPDYDLAVAFSRHMAELDWMIISGAGPGIMTAAIEGAGIENSFGVSIVLPFEAKAADIIEGDEKLAVFRYFFTRKLFFMKETDAFALFPGGFGTMDESFELLTLLQTGKSAPAPIVLMDHPDSSYWKGWSNFVEQELIAAGLVNEADQDLYFHTSDPAAAAEYLCEFYSCYHSMRFVGKRLIIRLNRALSDGALQTLNQEYAGILRGGEIEPADVSQTELRDGDHVELPRVALLFDNRSFARLISLVQRINELDGHHRATAARGLSHVLGPNVIDTD